MRSKILPIAAVFLLITTTSPLAAAIPPENMLDDFYDSIVSPFTGLVGDWFYAMIFMLLIGGIYMKSESWGPSAAVMIVVGMLFTGVLSSPVRLFFVIMTALGIGSLLVHVYRGRG